MTEPRKLSRRTLLSVIASTTATSCLPLAGAAILATESAETCAAQYTQVRASGEAAAPPPVAIIHRGYRLLIDPKNGSIASFQSTYGVDRDLLVPNHAGLPLFKIELMNEHREFKTVTSSQAKHITVHREEAEKEQTLTIEFVGVGDLPIDARVTVRCPTGEPLTYWNLELKNGTDSWVGHIQFPVIEVPFDNLKDEHLSSILWSIGDGGLTSPVEPSMNVGGWFQSRHNAPEIWRFNNYPGQWASTQLMAYYNDLGGLYIACDDAAGAPKFIDPLLEDDGVTMGLGHYPGTRGPGEVKLPYNVVLGTFHGDWYAAAEIYRDWASKQSFCATKLADRKDIPKWITESPIGIMFPMRGQCDWDPPAAVNPEYTPAANALPYLEKVAAELEASLMPLVFNWEKAGPWVQPDSFPPVGGEASMRELMVKAKEKGWHPGIYGDGLNWVTWQRNTDYDGMPYFRAHGGEAASAVNWDGTPLAERAFAWRASYTTCVATQGARQMVIDMTRQMAELGPAMVQQFDQGPGPKACYATNHGHPPVPGPWMIADFKDLLRADRDAARSANPEVAMSCEAAPPETFLQEFQIWDARVRNCPLYSFIYHEYGNGHEGLYTNRISDETLRLSVARALVTGYMVNFTLRDKGLITYDWDQPWTRAIPDQAAIFDWAKRVNQLRIGLARDYLIYGRMLRPWTVSKVTHRDFGWGMEALVQSATWQAQDGRIGVVLANFADLGESPRVELQGQGNKKLSLYIDGEQSERNIELPTVIDLDMLPRSLALIQVH
jgi:hypothetical protein